MAGYDPQILHTFADRLYSRATSVVATSTVLGLGIGALGGFLIENHDTSYAVAGAVPGALIGLAIGLERAFKLKLEAQLVLCQARIEENTRLR